MYEQWRQRGTELVNRILDGQPYKSLKRYGDIYGDDPADAAAASVNQNLESQHAAWLKKDSRQGSVIYHSAGSRTQVGLRLECRTSGRLKPLA